MIHARASAITGVERARFVISRIVERVSSSRSEGSRRFTGDVTVSQGEAHEVCSQLREPTGTPKEPANYQDNTAAISLSYLQRSCVFHLSVATEKRTDIPCDLTRNGKRKFPFLFRPRGH